MCEISIIVIFIYQKLRLVGSIQQKNKLPSPKTIYICQIYNFLISAESFVLNYHKIVSTKMMSQIKGSPNNILCFHIKRGTMFAYKNLFLKQYQLVN